MVVPSIATSMGDQIDHNGVKQPQNAGTILRGADPRCTTLVPTPTVRPMFKMPMLSAQESVCELQPWASQEVSSKPDALAVGPGKSGIEPLTDHSGFELREEAAHLKHCPP